MKIIVPATSANLGPGFDCIGMALDLYNEIEFYSLPEEASLKIEIEGEGEGLLSQEKDNLVYTSFLKIFEKLNLPVPGISLKLKNNIPLSRGLGSSSAAIVGGLAIGNKLSGNCLSTQELLNLAVEIEGHPDNVAPAIYGGIVISLQEEEGSISEKLEVQLEELACSVLVPEFELSTEKARDVLPIEIPLCDTVFNISRMAFLVQAFYTQNYSLLRKATEDRVHQIYRDILIPGMKDIFLEAIQQDAYGCAISGAGPSLLIIHGRETLNRFIYLAEKYEKENNLKAKVLQLKPVNQGFLFTDSNGGIK